MSDERGTPSGVAVLGLGRWGRKVLHSFIEVLGPGRVTAYDSDPAVRAQVRATQPSVRVVDDDILIWSDWRVQAVAIAAPTELHHPLAMRALQAKKHAFVEKPLADSLGRAREIVEAAQEARRTLMVDHVLLFHPAVEAIRARLRSDRIGELYYLYSQRTNLGVVRQHENVLWSLGPHDVSLFLTLAGALPRKVLARGATYLQRDREVEDIVFLSLLFDGGVQAHAHLSWLDPLKVRRLTVVGSQEMVLFDDMASPHKLQIHRRTVMQTDRDDFNVAYGEVELPLLPLDPPLVRACRHFIHCVETGSEPDSDGRLGLDVVRVLEAAQSSLKGGGEWVELAPPAVPLSEPIGASR